MARRTRSLSELPGHLRVPVLRRKDTERTKARLAAGEAGMEELRSLRQQQQQMVGDTMIKMENRQQQRRNRSNSDNSMMAPNMTREGSTSLQATLASWQSASSLSSISEEGSLAKPENYHQRMDHTPNSYSSRSRSRQSISNNNDNDRRRLISKNNTYYALPSPSSGHTAAAAPVNNVNSQVTTNSSLLDSTTACERKAYLHSWKSEGQINVKLNHHQHEDSGGNNKACGALGDSRSHKPNWPNAFSKSQVSTSSGRSPYESAQDRHKDTFNLSWRRSLQDSKSLHLPRSAIGEYDPWHLSQSSDSLSKISENGISTESFTKGNRRRLRSDSSPSNGQNNHITWDMLLKTIGITSSTSLTSLVEDNAISLRNDDDSDNVFNGVEENDSEPQTSAEKIPCRKLGRSASFSYGYPLPADLSRFQAPVEMKHSQEESSNHDPLQPILGRESMQWKAVLTHSGMSSRRVVNPIQDVDVQRLTIPGPLHAVTLQYRGLKQQGRPHAGGNTVHVNQNASPPRDSRDDSSVDFDFSTQAKFQTCESPRKDSEINHRLFDSDNAEAIGNLRKPDNNSKTRASDYYSHQLESRESSDIQIGGGLCTEINAQTEPLPEELKDETSIEVNTQPVQPVKAESEILNFHICDNENSNLTCKNNIIVNPGESCQNFVLPQNSKSLACNKKSPLKESVPRCSRGPTSPVSVLNEESTDARQVYDSHPRPSSVQACSTHPVHTERRASMLHNESLDHRFNAIAQAICDESVKYSESKQEDSQSSDCFDPISTSIQTTVNLTFASSESTDEGAKERRVRIADGTDVSSSETTRLTNDNNNKKDRYNCLGHQSKSSPFTPSTFAPDVNISDEGYSSTCDSVCPTNRIKDLVKNSSRNCDVTPLPRLRSNSHARSQTATSVSRTVEKDNQDVQIGQRRSVEEKQISNSTDHAGGVCNEDQPPQEESLSPSTETASEYKRVATVEHGATVVWLPTAYATKRSSLRSCVISSKSLKQTVV